MADVLTGDETFHEGSHPHQGKDAKPRRREGRRFWEGLWRLWPEGAYRNWDARPYDFDNYPELIERGQSTR